jgi:hypothetical protein
MPLTVTVGGKPVGVITLTFLGTCAYGLILLGEIKAAAIETRNLARKAASKEEVMAVATQVGRVKTDLDSTKASVMRHEVWSLGRSREIDSQFQDMKERLTYVERRGYRDRGDALPDSAVEYSFGRSDGRMVRKVPIPPRGRSLQEEWNVLDRGPVRREDEQP